MNYYDFKNKVKELGYFISENNWFIRVYSDKESCVMKDHTNLICISKVERYGINTNSSMIDSEELFAISTELASTSLKSREKVIYEIVKQCNDLVSIKEEVVKEFYSLQEAQRAIDCMPMELFVNYYIQERKFD